MQIRYMQVMSEHFHRPRGTRNVAHNMAPLTDEPMANHLYQRKPAGREYLSFALLLIALLLVSGAKMGLSSQTEAHSGPLVDPNAMTVSSQ